MAGFWQQRKTSEKWLLGICLLVMIVCIPMLLLPSSTSNKKLLPAREARQKYLKAVSDKNLRDAEIDRMKPEIDKLTYQEAPEELIPRVIRTLQTTAGKSGIHIREIKPLRVRRMAGVTKVPLSVRFSCDFAKTVPFLYSAEDPAGKLVVDRLNVTAPDAKSRIVDVEAHVAFFTTSTAAAAGETPTVGGT
jgi:hypothetical protein